MVLKADQLLKGNLLILPAALALGRRPVFLFCTVLLLGSTVGAAVSATFNAHLACRILEGIATGATESVRYKIYHYGESLPVM